MSTMIVLDRTGHTTYAWDEAGVATKTTGDGRVTDMTLAQVRTEFDHLVHGLRYFAATVEQETGGPTTGAVTRTFDPQADVVLTPQNVGG